MMSSASCIKFFLQCYINRVKDILYYLLNSFLFYCMGFYFGTYGLSFEIDVAVD